MAKVISGVANIVNGSESHEPSFAHSNESPKSPRVKKEKEVFSEVLMSTFHLMEELESRDLDHLTKEDFEHLEVDCNRVYEHLSMEWAVYMEHLQDSYPYLFYTAVKTNPYDQRKTKTIESELMKSYQA